MARFSMAIFHGETDQNNHWKSQHQAMAPNGKQTMSSVSGAQSFLCAVRELMKKGNPQKAWNRDVISDVSSAFLRNFQVSNLFLSF